MLPFIFLLHAKLKRRPLVWDRHLRTNTAFFTYSFCDVSSEHIFETSAICCTPLSEDKLKPNLLLSSVSLSHCSSDTRLVYAFGGGTSVQFCNFNNSLVFLDLAKKTHIFVPFYLTLRLTTRNLCQVVITLKALLFLELISENHLVEYFSCILRNLFIFIFNAFWFCFSQF